MDMRFNLFRKLRRPIKKWLLFGLFAAASLSLVFEAQQVLALDNNNNRETLVRTWEGEAEGLFCPTYYNGPCHHFHFDTHDLSNSGRIEVKVWIGDGKPSISFGLDRLDTAGNLTRVDKAYNIQPKSTATLTNNFSSGGKEFDLVICAGWGSPIGEKNSARYQVRIWSNEQEAIQGNIQFIHFIRKTENGFKKIKEISYNEPFYIKAEYSSEPQESKKTVMLNWGEGPDKSIIVNQQPDKKIYLSNAIYAKRPTSNGE